MIRKGDKLENLVTGEVLIFHRTSLETGGQACRRMNGQPASTSTRYLDRADESPRRAEGESLLLDQVSRDARRILDLGTGDWRLLALLRIDRPRDGVGVDFSKPMLEAARDRFAAVDGNPPSRARPQAVPPRGVVRRTRAHRDLREL